MTDSLPYSRSPYERRYPDRPSLWLLLVASSILLHLLAILGLRHWSARSVRVELAAAPISVEFVDPPTAPSPRTPRPASRPIAPVAPTMPAPSADRSTAIAPPTQPAPRTVVEPDRPQRQPAPRQATRRSEPPPAGQEKPKPLSAPMPPANNQPDLPTTEVSRGAERPPTDADSSGQANQTPTESGRILPGMAGEVTMVELLNQQQVMDFKQQQARARELNRQLSIYYPVKPPQPIEIEAHLDIGTQGEVLNVLDVKVLDSGGATVESEMLEQLARQVFKDWSFTPAQDGTPPQPVRSDLVVQARITVL